MATFGVIPAFQKFKDGHARLGLSAKAAPLDEFALPSVAKKLSAIALSKQSPAVPVEVTTAISRHRLPKASEVYCEPLSE